MVVHQTEPSVLDSTIGLSTAKFDNRNIVFGPVIR